MQCSSVLGTLQTAQSQHRMTNTLKLGPSVTGIEFRQARSRLQSKTSTWQVYNWGKAMGIKRNRAWALASPMTIKPIFLLLTLFHNVLKGWH